jgi:hypothetical protein
LEVIHDELCVSLIKLKKLSSNYVKFKHSYTRTVKVDAKLIISQNQSSSSNYHMLIKIISEMYSKNSTNSWGNIFSPLRLE